MLTPANTFLLGTIANQPTNPYEIVSRFEYNRMNRTLRIATSTIYANIRALCQKGLITFELCQDGSMPAKKVYTITDKGLLELTETLRHYLSEYTPDWTGFTVSLLLLHHFSKEELIVLLTRRLEALKALETQDKADYSYVANMQKQLPCIPALAGGLHVYVHMREEVELTKRVILLLKKAEVWPQNMFLNDDAYLNAYGTQAAERVELS